MELNLEMKQQLEKLLAKPVLVTEEHIPLLQNLIKTYPYYQPLYLLLAKAGFGTEDQQTFFAKAALYNNGNILHQIIHEPQKLKAISDLNVINYQPWALINDLVLEEVATTSPMQNVVIVDTINEDLKQITDNVITPDGDIPYDVTNSQLNDENTESDAEISVDTNEEQIAEEKIENPSLAELEVDTVEQIEEEKVDENDTLADAEEPEKPTEEVEIQSSDNEETQAVEHIEEDVDEDYTLAETEEPEKLLTKEEALTENTEENQAEEKTVPFVLPEIENLAPLESELLKIGIVIEPSSYQSVTEQISHPLADEQEKDEQDTFEEVGDLVVPQETVENTPQQDEPQTGLVSDEVESVTTPENKIEELAIENIANTDFFAFESNLSSEVIQSVEEDQNKEKTSQPVSEAKTTSLNSENIISKYDDDKLPFTFVWWLQKTRKDHEQIFRPFVAAAKADSPIADLQQQYVENIFHLQSPLDVNPEEEPVFNTQKPNTKGNQLVDKFIKDDPQIKVPKPDQINNVNKAKKSAVDNYDVVSETLADIYIEQMLYHKAIDTYQKLSLKFPEKSRYFADLILSLEKKI